MKRFAVSEIMPTFASVTTKSKTIMYKEREDLILVEDTDTMDLEEARKLLHEMVEKEYAAS